MKIKILKLNFILFTALILTFNASLIFSSKALTQVGYQFELISKVPSNLVINKIEINSRNKGLIIATSGGLYLITDIDQSSFLNEYDVSDFAFNSNTFWIASGNKIIKEDQTVIYELPNNAKINSIEIVRNVIWVGSNLGLHQISLANGRVILMNSKNSDYGKGEVNFIHKDKDNTLWIGCNHGSYRIYNEKWKLYEKGVNVLDYTENKEGMWFISKDDIWLIDYQNRYYQVGMDEDLVAGKLNDFAIDDKGKLYFSSNKLVRYDPYESATQEFTDLVTQLTSVSTSVVFKDGSLYIGTKNKGLYKIVFKESMSDDYFINVIVDKNLTCQGSSDAKASVYPQGGQAPYKYAWLESGKSDSTVDGLGAGLHTVAVTDARGRTLQKTIQISDASPIPLPKVTIVHPKAGSDNGSFSLAVIAGQKYLLNGVELVNSKDKLAAGLYEIKIANEKGCTAIKKILLVSDKQLEWLNEDSLQVGRVVNVDKISFKADSVDITASSYLALEEIYQFILANPTFKLEIGGHTNTLPSDEYCDQLSTARAKNIAEYFYAKGITPSRLTYKGYGKRFPISLDSSPEARKLNQRVELKVIAR